MQSALTAKLYASRALSTPTTRAKARCDKDHLLNAAACAKYEFKFDLVYKLMLLDIETLPTYTYYQSHVRVSPLSLLYIFQCTLNYNYPTVCDSLHIIIGS